MKYIYLILSALLLLCLAPMPYGYYQLVRFVAMIAFTYFAYVHFNYEEEGLGVLFLALAILFQPFFKIALGRTMWNVVDVVVAILLFIFLYKSKRKS